MNVLSRLAKAHTIVMIGAILVGIYETYRRRKNDEENSEKDKEIKRLKEELAASKVIPVKKKR